MNIWFIVSLLPPLLWGCANVLDAASRRHFVKSDLALTWFLAITRLPVVLGILLIFGFHTIPSTETFLMLLSGILWMAPFMLYYKAMEFEDPSVITLVTQVMPVFIYIIAYFLLGETLTLPQLDGFVLLLSGGILAALKRFQNSWRISKAFWIMTLAAVMWSFSDVLFKQNVAQFQTFWDAIIVYLFGGAICGIIITIFSEGHKKIIPLFFNLSARGWLIILITQIIGLAGTIALSYALLLGKASLTVVISGLQPLIAFASAFPIAKLLPEVSRENTDFRSIALKATAFIMTIIGLTFLYYNA